MAKHFLYHIFCMDKQENPMPEGKRLRLLRWIRDILRIEKGET